MNFVRYIVVFLVCIKIVFGFAVSSSIETETEQCAFYIAPSALQIEGIGRGVFAGRNFTKDEILDVMISVTIPYDNLWNGDWSLRNYVFAHEEEGECMAVFGIAMLFNHRSIQKVHHYWNDRQIAHVSDSYYTPSSVMTPVVFETAVSVRAGEELYVNYGSNEWFEDRGITVHDGNETSNSSPASEEKILSTDVLKNTGFCLDQTYVKQSTYPLAGYGLFAKRSFRAGDIVTISPVLALPAKEVASIRHESVLMNYCLSDEESEVALLPIGYAAVINHDSNANLRMDWYDGWDGMHTHKICSDWQKCQAQEADGEVLPASSLPRLRALSLDTASILHADYSQLDLKYTATRDIKQGEELSIDYGSAWLADWAAYLAKSLSYKARSGPFESGNTDKFSPPLFRAFIQAPPGLLPPQWKLPDMSQAARADVTAANKETK